MLLAALGTLEYNGYSFDGTSKVTVSVEYVTDEAGRTVVYQRHVFRVVSIIQDDAKTDTAMAAIRRLLGEQGRPFTFITRGFGDDVIVNSPAGGLKDVRFGPKPKVLNWEVIAGNRAVQFVWECEVCVPFCPDSAVARTSGLMELNYSLVFSIDDKGYTTRTITGYLRIAMTRDGRDIPDTADEYLDEFSSDVPEGFKRSCSRTLSLDKSRVDFTLTDVEIPSPNGYPAGIVDISIRHRVGWRRGSGLPRNVISGSIEVASDRPMEHALLTFMAIANQRIDVAKAAVVDATSVNGGTATVPTAVLIDEFSIDEDIYSRSASFSLGYRVPATLAEFIWACGIWTPTVDTWADWHSSIVAEQSQVGHAGLVHKASDDHITDPCESTSELVQSEKVLSELVAHAPLSALKNEKPEANNSWLKYEQNIKLSRERPVARQRILQTADVDFGGFYPNQTTGIVYPPNAGQIDVIQQGGQSSYYAIVTGRAARAGYEIPRPQYDLVGSVTPVEIEGDFEQAIVSNWFGCPIYGAQWRIVYYLDSSPGAVELQPNPKEFLDGNGQATPG